MTEWPLLERYERELAWRDRGVVALVAPGDVPPYRYALPPPLIELAAKLEAKALIGPSLATTCTEQVAAELVSQLWRRARELAARGRLDVELSARVEGMSPQDIVTMIASVVRNAFDFEIDHASLRWRVLRVLELMRGGMPLRIARRAVGARRVKAVCLDFATAMQALFVAVKRVTPGLAHAYVISIGGRALDFDTPSGHAWNWLVDANAGSIVVIDASAPRAAAAWRHWHVSGLLATTYDRALRGLDREDLAMLIRSVVDATTERGLTLLYHFANHITVPPSTRRRIGEYLVRGGFDRAVPGWRDKFARRDREHGTLQAVLAPADDRDEAIFGAL